MKFSPLLPALFLAALCASVHADEAKPLRLFVLSGQSNMNNLPAQEVFIPTVTAAFPDDEVVVVKDAVPGKPITRWLLTDPGLERAAKKPKGKSGDLYRQLMARVREAMGDRRADAVVFLWLQGETDGQNDVGDVYGVRLDALLAQVRTDLRSEELGVVLARISDTKVGQPSWDAVRKAQEQAAEADPLIVLVDTDDLNGKGNGMHYDGPGYRKLGERLAEQAIALSRQLQPAKP